MCHSDALTVVFLSEEAKCRNSVQFAAIRVNTRSKKRTDPRTPIYVPEGCLGGKLLTVATLGRGTGLGDGKWEETVSTIYPFTLPEV